MVGSSIVRALTQLGEDNLIVRTREELDLTNQAAVKNFFEKEKPTQVYLAAAKVGGIYANNTFPADFIYQNLIVQANVIDAAFRSGVRKLLFLGSSCIYPRMADQPIREEELLKGVLEPTNEPYAISKIAGIKLCESYNRQYGESLGVDYRSVMPANLYGPNDNYHSENSHVVPALLRRVHMAMVHKSEEVVIWGTGAPRREFLYVDDLASAVVHVMQLTKTKYAQYTLPMQNYINVGYGTDVTIEELTNIIAQVIGYSGRIIFDITKPDGVPQKLLDSSRINALGWHSKIDLKTGIKLAYQDFLKRSIK